MALYVMFSSLQPPQLASPLSFSVLPAAALSETRSLVDERVY